jgi:hypothetical protein
MMTQTWCKNAAFFQTFKKIMFCNVTASAQVPSGDENKQHCDSNVLTAAAKTR